MVFDLGRLALFGNAAIITILIACFLGDAFADDGKAEAFWRLSGEARARYETLDGQFRAGGNGGDQALFFRTLAHFQSRDAPVQVGVELQDSRAYLTDEATPLSSSFVNALDVLQAYISFPAPGVLGDGSTTRVQIGRQTVSIGSKRQIERVTYANVIKNYTGAHIVSSNPRGDELHIFGVAPVERKPDDRPSINDNEIVADREQFGRWIWGAHYRRADAMPAISSDVWLEAFVYGLTEHDTDRVQTPNRQYVAPGFRLFRKPTTGMWNIDIEGALRIGSRRETSAPTDASDRDVFASSLIARIGYTFDQPWRPDLALQYYWASGDKDPTDDRFDQHERLFGGRRTDLNNTSIHGPLTPANLSAFGARLSVKPSARTDARLTWSAASLASATDAWVIGRLRDETGGSGRFLGHVIDARARAWLIPDRARLELGGSAFLFGTFPKNVPNGPQGARTLFGYAQIEFPF